MSYERSSRFTRMVPMTTRRDPFFHHWWSDFDRPLRLFDQNFAMGMHADDVTPPTTFPHCYPSWRHFGRQNSGKSEVKFEKDKFQVLLDVQQFSPEELSVKTTDNYIIVEGNHQEKEDEHGFISRNFTRKYTIPEDVDPETISSSLSPDGVLTVTAPLKVPQLPAAEEKVIPIIKSTEKKKEKN